MIKRIVHVTTIRKQKGGGSRGIPLKMSYGQRHSKRIKIKSEQRNNVHCILQINYNSSIKTNNIYVGKCSHFLNIIYFCLQFGTNKLSK